MASGSPPKHCVFVCGVLMLSVCMEVEGRKRRGGERHGCVGCLKTMQIKFDFKALVDLGTTDAKKSIRCLICRRSSFSPLPPMLASMQARADTHLPAILSTLSPSQTERGMHPSSTRMTRVTPQKYRQTERERVGKRKGEGGVKYLRWKGRNREGGRVEE